MKFYEGTSPWLYYIPLQWLMDGVQIRHLFKLRKTTVINVDRHGQSIICNIVKINTHKGCVEVNVLYQYALGFVIILCAYIKICYKKIKVSKSVL